MWVFALLVAGFGANTTSTTPETDPLPLTVEVKPKHFFEPHFEATPPQRGFMVVTPTPRAALRQKRQGASQWLEPPQGWAAPDLKSRPYRVEPLSRPKRKTRSPRNIGQ